MTIFYPIIFLIGLGFGSFASVIIHRLYYKEEGIFWGRSKCPTCKHVLNAIDLIPLLGCLINKLKCRYCKKPISLRYPLLELTMGLFFILTSFLTGFSNPFILSYYLLITFIFVLLSFYDIQFQEIPDEISLPTILLTGIVGYFGHLNTLSDLLIGFAIPVAFFSVLFFGSRGKWLGGGDVRIGGIMGFLLGWPNVIVGLFIGYLVGAIYSLAGLLSGKFTRKSSIPFGPFLLLGSYFALFFGHEIISWYLGLI